jgi:hypothetical protein
MEKILNKTHIKVYGTDIEFTMQGDPTYREIIRYAIQNDIPIKPQPIFSITRPPDPTYWDQFTGDSEVKRNQAIIKKMIQAIEEDVLDGEFLDLMRMIEMLLGFEVPRQLILEYIGEEE